MLQLENKTPFKAISAILPDIERVDTAYVFIRGSFDLSGRQLAGDFQEPPRIADEYWGEPSESSIKFAGDIALSKLGTDVLLLGDAKAPHDKAVSSMLVRLRVGAAIDKTLAITGNRTWRKNFFGFLKPSAPEPFVSMPLSWENAYGGSDQIKDDESTRQTHAANPLGCGLIHPDHSYGAPAGRKLPNIEYLNNRIRSWKDTPPPAGFGAIAPRWKPRCDYVGTYDKAWRKKRAPYYPKDFDLRFFQVAPHDQIVSEKLKGGEPVEISGVKSDGAPIQFQIPTCPLTVTYQFANTKTVATATIETVTIQPDEGQVSLVWMACCRCDKQVLKLEEMIVSASQN